MWIFFITVFGGRLEELEDLFLFILLLSIYVFNRLGIVGVYG